MSDTEDKADSVAGSQPVDIESEPDDLDDKHILPKQVRDEALPLKDPDVGKDAEMPPQPTAPVAPTITPVMQEEQDDLAAERYARRHTNALWVGS